MSFEIKKVTVENVHIHTLTVGGQQEAGDSLLEALFGQGASTEPETGHSGSVDGAAPETGRSTVCCEQTGPLYAESSADEDEDQEDATGVGAVPSVTQQGRHGPVTISLVQAEGRAVFLANGHPFMLVRTDGLLQRLENVDPGCGLYRLRPSGRVGIKNRSSIRRETGQPRRVEMAAE